MADNKKIIAIAIVAIVVVAAVAGVVAVAVANSHGSGMEKTDLKFETDDGVAYDVYKGTRHMNTENVNSDVPFYYSDGYFMQDAKLYNNHLASLSMAMSTAAMDRNSSGITDMFGKLGFGNHYVSHDYGEEPGMSTVAFVAAVKKVTVGETEKTIVAIAFRSSGFGSEWLNSLYVGVSGEEAGPSGAADKAFGELKKFLEDKKIDGSGENTAFWLSGYSRGATLANLVGKRIIDDYNGNGNRTFCYGFASLMAGHEDCVKEGNDYSGLFSVTDSTDVMTKLAPGYMGFMNYGTEVILPPVDVESDVQGRMLKFLQNYKIAPLSPSIEMYTMVPGEMALGIKVPNFVDTGLKIDVGELERTAVYILGEYCEVTREVWMNDLIPIATNIQIPTDISIGELINVGIPLLDLLFSIENDALSISDIDGYLNIALGNYNFAPLADFLKLSEDQCRTLVTIVMKFAYGDCKETLVGFGIIGTVYQSYEEIYSHSQPAFYMAWTFASDSFYKI